MKVAIVGGGFAGIATAYFLQQVEGVSVEIFEEKKVGGGASGVCSGLLHPYPGMGARRSHEAESALTMSRELLRLSQKWTSKRVASYEGILRKSQSKEQKNQLLSHIERWGDIERLDTDLFLIQSGITVSSLGYLEGLANFLSESGVQFHFEKISSLDELASYDYIVIAAGFGLLQFADCRNLRVKYLKGQVLSLSGESPHKQSCISKGYFARMEGAQSFEIGSTYEEDFIDIHPDKRQAQELLKDKLALCKRAKILDCFAAVRVCNLDHYLPIIERVRDNAHVFTALGSRGLLYHAFFGKRLAETILFNKVKIL